jgi:hypothetical protein
LKDLTLFVYHPASQSLGTPPIQEGSYEDKAEAEQNSGTRDSLARIVRGILRCSRIFPQ